MNNDGGASGEAQQPAQRHQRTQTMPPTGLRRSARIAKLQEDAAAAAAAAAATTASAQLKPTTARTRATRAPNSRGAGANKGMAASGREWEVERIVGSRICPETLQHFYEVKWKSFPSNHNTWEPKINLGHCSKAISEFEREMRRK